MFNDATINVYKKLLQYVGNYCETNSKYYTSSPTDYDIKILYNNNDLITLQHSANMKRSAEDITKTIVKIISDEFGVELVHKRYFGDRDTGNYMYSIDDTSFAVEVIKK